MTEQNIKLNIDKKTGVKTLIYELFSGVGLCNQLFSLETAIYLANISNRKLILLIKNPLCHCGKSSWDYGYLLNFFTNEFLQYLPNGFDVYYKSTPKDILDIINNKNKTHQFKYCDKFSNLVFIDKHLDTDENSNNIKDFCHYRKKEYLQFDELSEFEYFYINQTNASRCFYNFYTTNENYNLMYKICCSLKFIDFFYKCSEKIYSGLNNKNNNYNIFIHCRFGDLHRDKEFIERYNNDMIKNISNFYDGHRTNLITPNMYLLYDNKNNSNFFEKIKKYNPISVENLTKNYIETYLNNNKMLYNNIINIKNYVVANAIIEMILCLKSDEFIGTVTSTFSHYIQFLRYQINKSYYNYSNINKSNVEFCRLQEIKKSNIPWIKYEYNGGHPVSWHIFWDLNQNQNQNQNQNKNQNQTLFTITGKTDGFGSQLQACFSLIAYCYYKNYTYIHTPMYRMHHNDENMKNFANYMNEFINFEYKFKTINEISNYETSILNEVKEGFFVHGSLNPEYFYNKFVLNLLREIYYSNFKPNIASYDNTKKNIAIHIRRGDVNREKYPSRFISNEIYIDLIKKIDLSNSLIHIFSEGNSEDFKDIIESFPENKFILHLNENIQLTFHHMVKADILVISKSSFSYCAGLLNENTVIANLITSWWHKPLKQWKKI